MKPHSRHNKLQHAWLDGETIQKQADSNKDIWFEIDANHSWQECSQYRIKPAEPERVYPVTNMRNHDLDSTYDPSVDYFDKLRAVANAAIRRAIDDGQVVTTKEFVEIIKNAHKAGESGLSLNAVFHVAGIKFK